MSATKAIIISAPKFIAAEPALEVTLSSSSSLVNSNICRTKTLKRTSFQCVSTMEKITCPPLPTTMLAVEANPTSSRKRRLDHLSIDEKIQRKKLKNRIAAQSSRDRKKAKMDELEMEVKELKDKVTSLVSQCSRLQGEVSRLAQENTSLRRQLSERRGSERASAESASAESPAVGCAPAAAGPAASRRPPPQGRGAQPAAGRLPLAPSLSPSTTPPPQRALTSLLAVLLLAATAKTPCPRSSTSSTPWTETSPSRSSKSWPAASSQRPWRTKRLLEPMELRQVMSKWWGRHQKTWNPVESS